jgi:2-polyprenyl-3-methyl-5-hydroxy-6-metoxy-1,4-benzoquinol methylase
MKAKGKTKAYRTARARSKPSVPITRLAKDGLLDGRCLDYGCGKSPDAEVYDMKKFDPHFSPEMPKGKFDTITCTYVLNVIESETERFKVLLDIQSRLTPTGIAYITVRNDIKSLNGKTSTGTWQGKITLNLPIQYKTSSYITYILT